MSVVRFPQELRTADRSTNRVYPGGAVILILPCIRVERHAPKRKPKPKAKAKARPKRKSRAAR